MGEIKVELEFFKDGLPIDGDLNEYGINNYRNALYSAAVALDDNIADDIAFYISVDDEEPLILSYTKESFKIEEVSEKLDKTIRHLGA